MKIKDLEIGKGLGSGLKCFVAAIAGKTTKKGDDYIQVTLKDETGETKVNVWQTSVETWEYKLSDIVLLTGSVGEYAGNAQLNISSWSKSEGSLSDFVRQSDRDIVGMYQTLVKDHIEKFKTPFIQYLANRMIMTGPFAESFLKAPAARSMHHPWIGGLLEHVLGLCNLADSMYESHYKVYFPNLDMEKVKFGCIFHDWGKVLEYDFSTPALTYTERGIYQHHIGIVQEYITRCAVAYEQEQQPKAEPNLKGHRALLNELSHIIYSHHGQIEWSALMKPATPEALFVHWLDNFDAQLMNMRESLQKGTSGSIPGWTERNWALGTQFKHQDVTTGGNQEF